MERIAQTTALIKHIFDIWPIGSPKKVRLVPFSAEGWAALQQHAEAFSREGRRVSPAQVAAVLLDRALLGDREGLGGLFLDAEASRAPELRLENPPGEVRTVSGTQATSALAGYLRHPRVYEQFDEPARAERRSFPNQITR